jgi:hypothetical protein
MKKDKRKFRPLIPGEIIKVGDQGLVGRRWFPIAEEHWVPVGKPYSCFFVKIRRPLPNTTVSNPAP